MDELNLNGFQHQGALMCGEVFDVAEPELKAAPQGGGATVARHGARRCCRLEKGSGGPLPPVPLLSPFQGL
jgi:hypothetical protein